MGLYRTATRGHQGSSVSRNSRRTVGLSHAPGNAILHFISELGLTSVDSDNEYDCKYMFFTLAICTLTAACSDL